MDNHYDRYNISFESIKFIAPIGSGKFSNVYKGVLNEKTYAIKKLDIKYTEQCGLSHFNEINTLITLKEGQAPYTIYLHGCVQYGSFYYLVMDLAEKGALTNWLNKLPYFLRLLTMFKFSQSVEFLHNSNLVHGDIKPENILLDHHFEPKLADFGFVSPEGKMIEPHGTPLFMAPEVLSSKLFHITNRKTDVYGVGLVFWMILNQSKDFPYEKYLKNHDLPELLNIVVESKIREAIPDDCLPIFKDTIQKSWDADPLKRPDMSEIVSVLKTMVTDCKASSKKSRKFTFFDNNDKKEKISFKKIHDMKGLETAICAKFNKVPQLTSCFIFYEKTEKIIQNIGEMKQLNSKDGHRFHLIFNPKPLAVDKSELHIYNR